MTERIDSSILRNSSIELLRIFCGWSIIALHTFGEYLSTCSDPVKVFYGVVVNSLCNIDICTFVLISGYFGIVFSFKRFFKIEIQLLFYSLIYFCLYNVAPLIINNELITVQFFKNMFLSCIPTVSFFNRFFSQYIVLMFLGKWINRGCAALNKKEFIIIIIIIISFFSFFQTFLPRGIQLDTGKGFLNMIMMYLIGRFIRLHLDENYKKSYCLMLFSFVILLETGLNLFLTFYTRIKPFTFIRNLNPGVNAPFARDLSIFIVAGSVFIFLFAKSFHFYNRTVNYFSKTIAGVVLSNNMIISILRYMGIWEKIQVLPGVTFIFALILCNFFILFLCQIFEMCRGLVFKTFENSLYSSIEKKWFGCASKILN